MILVNRVEQIDTSDLLRRIYFRFAFAFAFYRMYGSGFRSYRDDTEGIIPYYPEDIPGRYPCARDRTRFPSNSDTLFSIILINRFLLASSVFQPCLNTRAIIWHARVRYARGKS